MSKHNAKVPEGMVVGNGQPGFSVVKKLKALATQSRLGRLKQRRYMLACAALLVLVVGGALLYSQLHHTSAPYAVREGDSAGGDLAIMNQDELNAAAIQNTGHSLDDLKSKNVNSRLLKTFHAADYAGQIYAQVGLQDKSLQAFAIASDKAAADDYKFHIRYAGAAINLGKVDVAKAQLAAARASLAKNTSLSDQDHQGASRSIAILEGYVSGGGAQ